MAQLLFYPAGISESCRYCEEILRQFNLLTTDHVTPEITHLLLDIPSFGPEGKLRDGSSLEELLRTLPTGVTVIGGNLQHPCLAGYRTMDLLEDPGFLAQNAYITAECALRIAGPCLKTTFADTNALILGWGRIGKHLARLLHSLGCTVTIAARHTESRALAQSYGYQVVDFPQISSLKNRFQLLFNTVPQLPFHESPVADPNTLLIDLASSPGMDGWHAVTARGLPGKYAPETTGKLIVKTILRKLSEEPK